METKIKEILNQSQRQLYMMKLKHSADINDEEMMLHENLIVSIGNRLLVNQSKTLEISDKNRDVFRFLTFYFLRNKKAENVYPGKGYTLDKNIMLIGPAGTGKTLIMQIFSEYLRATANDMYFQNCSVTQMINYYKVNNHLDRYTYCEQTIGGRRESEHTINVCMNDIGLNTHTHFGTDTKIFIEDFLHARYEMFANNYNKRYTHITTNLTPKQLSEVFGDEHNRLVDRFKTYNVIYLTGESMR